MLVTIDMKFLPHSLLLYIRLNRTAPIGSCQILLNEFIIKVFIPISWFLRTQKTRQTPYNQYGGKKEWRCPTLPLCLVGIERGRQTEGGSKGGLCICVTDITCLQTNFLAIRASRTFISLLNITPIKIHVSFANP